MKISQLSNKLIAALSLVTALGVGAVGINLNKHAIPPVDKEQMSTPKAAKTPSDNPLDDLAPDPADDVPTSTAAPVKQVAPREPTTESGVPIDVIRAAINANNDLTAYKSFPVQTWTETNTYTRKINDETVVIIEIRGTFHVTPAGQADIDRIQSASKPNSSYVLEGQVALVKRGNSWYIYKG